MKSVRPPTDISKNRVKIMALHESYRSHATLKHNETTLNIDVRGLSFVKIDKGKNLLYCSDDQNLFDLGTRSCKFLNNEFSSNFRDQIYKLKDIFFNTIF